MTVRVLKNKAVLNLKQYCVDCYVALSDVFEIVSTMTFLVFANQAQLRYISV